MAVDRGGLQYTIEVRDKFSATTQLFRKELRSAKAAFRDFQGSLNVNRKGVKSLKALADASKALASAEKTRASTSRKTRKEETAAERQQRKFLAIKERILDQRAIEPRLIAEGLKLQKQETRVLTGQERTLRRIRDAKVRILRQRKIENALIAAGLKNAKREARALTVVEEAQRRVAKAIRARAVAQAQLSQLRAGGQGDLITPALLKRAGEFDKSTSRAAKSAKSLFFSFRRLVGILAVFTLARRLVQGFQDLVKLGLRFGDTLESARVSIAGIVLATGEIRDEFGETVKGVEALTRAEGLAAAQIRALRQDALATTATFEQLLDTFQIAVGPGIAAGLNLDEIRKLSVSISQAATAIGLPQNQLAEEIRSLLSGTIQARTTRIATVLGISNADIRRLKETGDLFEFLEDRFSAFSDSAKKQARETLTGIRALVTGALGEVLGRAAGPLRDELLDTLNDVLDNVLLIQDETGKVAPRPEVVAAFREIFDALKIGIERARELGEELGFEGLKDLLSALGTGLLVAIEFTVGFVQGLLAVFIAIKGVVDAIAESLGLTNKDLGKIAGVLGGIIAAMFVWNNTAGLVGLSVGNILRTLVKVSKLLVGAVLRNMTAILGVTKAIFARMLLIVKSPLFLAAAALAAVLKLTELWFEKILDVELGFGDVANLISIGIIEAIDDAITLARLLIAELQGAIDAPGEAVAGVANTLGDIGLATLAGLGSETAELALEQSLTEQAGVIDGLLKQETERERLVRETKEQLLQELEARRELRRLAIENIANAAQAREDAKAAEDSAAAEAEAQAKAALDAASAAAEAAGAGDEFFGTLSNANQVIRDLAEGLVEVQDELRAAGIEFAALSSGGGAGLGGIAGNIGRVFTQAAIADAERLNKIVQEQRNIQKQINELLEKGAITQERVALIQEARRELDPAAREELLTALELTEAESTLISLFRDKLDLSEAILEAQGLQNELAVARAAIIASQEIPGLLQQNQILQANADAEERIAAAVRGRVSNAERGLVAATQALSVAQAELTVERNARTEELQFLRDKAAIAAETGQDEELAELLALIDALEIRAELEERIATARLDQLMRAQEEADLIANGSLADGLREGFADVLEQLPTRFEQGVAIIKGSITQLSAFISDSIVKAFDPTDDSTIKERFARFLQSIASLILNQIITLLIATAIAKAFGVPLPGDSTPPPNIPGVADGGEVPGFARGGRVRSQDARPRIARRTPGVRGFARGGRARDPRDTVPAFLQPGEFVMRKSAVDSVGVGFFNAVNQGQFNPAAAPASAPLGAGAAAVGMQTGGLVADRVDSESTVAASEGADASGGQIVLPAIVAKEREMDRLANGGKNGLMTFFRENAGTINGLLKRNSR